MAFKSKFQGRTIDEQIDYVKNKLPGIIENFTNELSKINKDKAEVSSVPQKTSQITNDSGYITGETLEEALSGTTEDIINTLRTEHAERISGDEIDAKYVGGKPIPHLMTYTSDGYEKAPMSQGVIITPVGVERGVDALGREQFFGDQWAISNDGIIKHRWMATDSDINDYPWSENLMPKKMSQLINDEGFTTPSDVLHLMRIQHAEHISGDEIDTKYKIGDYIPSIMVYDSADGYENAPFECDGIIITHSCAIADGDYDNLFTYQFAISYDGKIVHRTAFKNYQSDPDKFSDIPWSENLIPTKVSELENDKNFVSHDTIYGDEIDVKWNYNPKAPVVMHYFANGYEHAPFDQCIILNSVACTSEEDGYYTIIQVAFGNTGEMKWRWADIDSLDSVDWEPYEMGVPNPQSDWNQTDPTKADFIKNKPTLGKGLSSNDYTDTDKEKLDNMTKQIGDIETDISAKATALTDVASGVPIYLTNSEKANLKGLNIYGKTIQNGTPTPDTPVDLESIGDVNISSCGKNLIPLDKLKNKSSNGINIDVNTDGTLHVYGTASADTVIYYYEILSLLSGTYTLSGCSAGGGSSTYRLLGYFVDTKQNIYDDGSGKTYTSTKKSKFTLGIKVFKGVVIDETFKPMLEVGNTVTEYTPYEGSKISLSTPNGLPGILVSSDGNYTDESGQQWMCDEVDFARGVYVKRVGVYEFTGNESFNNQSASFPGDSTYLFCSNLNNLGRKSFGSFALNNDMCSRFKNAYKNVQNAKDTTEEIFAFHATPANANYIYFRVFKTRFTSESMTAEWKNMLKTWHTDGVPLTVSYCLETPIEIPLTSEQIDAYKTLNTQNAITNILNDKGAYMTIKYNIDTQAYIDTVLEKVKKNTELISELNEKVPTTVQTTGDSETDVMSQKAVTEELNQLKERKDNSGASLANKLNKTITELRTLKNSVDESVSSLIQVNTENGIEQKITIPSVGDHEKCFVRVGLHYESPRFTPSSSDEIYFNKTCRPDFSDVRFFDGNGKMLKAQLGELVNLELSEDKNIRNVCKVTSQGYLICYNEQGSTGAHGSYISTLPQGMLISKDNGVSYQVIEGTYHVTENASAVYSRKSIYPVFVDSDDNIFGYAGGKLYKLYADGDYSNIKEVLDFSWVRNDGSILYPDIQTHGIDADLNGNLILGSYQETDDWHVDIYASRDGGETWTLAWYSHDDNCQHVHHIHADKYSNKVYIGMDNARDYNGARIVVTEDGGLSFTDITEQIPVRGKDFYPTYFGDGYRLGGCEAHVMGNASIYRSEDDITLNGVVKGDANVRAFADFGDDSLILCGSLASSCVSENHILVSYDQGRTWKSIYKKYQKPFKTSGIGCRYIYDARIYPGETEPCILLPKDTGYVPSFRIYKGGDHWYREAYIELENTPNKGENIELTVKTGYMMAYPYKCLQGREHDGFVYGIPLNEGIGNEVVDTLGHTIKIEGNGYNWEKSCDSVRYGGYIGSDALRPLVPSSGLKLDKGTKLNFGKIPQLNFSNNYTITFWLNTDAVSMDPKKFGNPYMSHILDAGNISLYNYNFYYGLIDQNVVSFSSTAIRSAMSFPTTSLKYSNDYYFIAFSISENHECTMYINGTVGHEKIQYGLSGYNWINLSDGDLVLGSDKWEPLGYLSDIKFYNKAMDEKEILELYRGW